MSWEELRTDIERIFLRKMKKAGLFVSLDLHFIEDAPIVGDNVYGEAFPSEGRIWLEVVAPEASRREITETICHECVHMLRPDLDHDSEEFTRLVNELCKR